MTHPVPPIRGLPGPVLAILYVAALLLPLLLALMSGRGPQGPWQEAASGLGFVAAVALMLQFVTSGRFESLSGRIGIDTTMAFHKWVARTLAVIVVIHPLLYVMPQLATDPGRALWRFGHLLTSPRYLTGVVALVLLLTVVVLALLRDRLGARYEAWRASHAVLALAAAAFTVLHALRAGSYSRELPLSLYWPLLAVLVVAAALVIYGIRTWRMRTTPWRVASVEKVADGLWELRLAAETGARLAYRAGQFAWIAFGRWRFPLLDHPFSIGAAPAASDGLSFVIKESGDFTHHIGAMAPGTPVGLDAPHGSFVLDDAAQVIVLVAGGVGIAPVLGLLRELAARGDRRPIRLVYAGGRPDGMIAPERLIAEAAGLDLKAIFLAEEAGAGWAHDRGRVTPEVVTRALDGCDPARVSAMLCGPGVMMCAVCDLLHRAGVPLKAIRYERFDYADGARSAKDRQALLHFAGVGVAVLAAVVAFALR